MNRLEETIIKHYVKDKLGVDLDKGTIDPKKVKTEMTEIVTALLGFFSSSSGETLLAKADTELLTLVNTFIKSHVKAATAPATAATS